MTPDRRRKPGQHKAKFILGSLPLAEADETERLGVSGGEPSALVYVEDRLIGPGKWPSSLLFSNLRKVISRTGNDGARAAMCQFLATEFFPQPVAWERWPAVLYAARERANENNTTPEHEIVIATAQAIALIHPSEVESSPERSFEQIVRQRVNDIVTEDLLGSDWRHGRGMTTQGAPSEVRQARVPDRPGPGDEAAILARQFGQELIALAKLSPGEADVLLAIVEGRTVEEYAKTKGIKASGARNSLSRARRKIRQVSG